MKKVKKVIAKPYSHVLDEWVDDYFKNNPAPKYSEQNKPKTELERAEALLEIVGAEKMKEVIKLMEKHNDYTIDIGQLKRLADKIKVKKAGK